MTYFVNSTEARNSARTNLAIFDEVSYLMRSIIESSDNGAYSLEVDDGTLMTESTPSVEIVGTEQNPTVTVGDTIIIGGATFILGDSGVLLNNVISDINDQVTSGILPGLVASKDDGKLVLTYETPQSSWDVTIGAGTANTALGLLDTTIQAPSPSSVEYFSSWIGTTTDRKINDEINRVISYFTNLGFNVILLKNSNTNNTFKWVINW